MTPNPEIPATPTLPIPEHTDETPAVPSTPIDAAVEPAVPVVVERVNPREDDAGYAEQMALLETLAPDEEDVPFTDADPGDEAEETEADELPAEGTVAEEVSDEAQPAAAKTEGAPSDLDGAKASLNEAGWRMSDLESLSDDVVLRMGGVAAGNQGKTQAKFDGFSAEIGTLKEKLEAAGSKSDPEPGGESPGQPASANLAALTKHFSEKTGLDERDVEPLMADLQATVVGPIAKELKDAQGVIGNLNDVVTDMVFSQVKSEITGKYPGLSEAGGEAKLKEKISRLNPEAYAHLPFAEKVRAMTEEAAGMAFPKSAATPPKTASNKRSPTNRQPTLPGKRPSTQKLSHEAQEMATLEAIERKYGMMK